MQALVHSFNLIIPIAFGGILHMLAVKKDLFPKLKIPISRSLFGDNKTYRGLFLMPLFTVIGTVLQALLNAFPGVTEVSLVQAVKLGCLLGLFYILFELPNSFFKRRLGIPPGKQADRYKVLFRILDRFDSTLGCIVVFYFYLNVPVKNLWIVLAMGIFIHAVVTNTLFMLGIRKERW